jgi:hypothetical protein
MNTKDGISQNFMEPADQEVPARFDEQLRLTGIDVSTDEIHELQVLDDFLAHHVQRNSLYNVQCMLLWSEWVRTFRRRIQGFPKLIREKEFQSIIAEMFAVAIAHDEIRGAVFPGIRFIP